MNSGILNLGFAMFDADGPVASVANGNGSNTRFTYDTTAPETSPQCSTR